jgi:hypothetical protein
MADNTDDDGAVAATNTRDESASRDDAATRDEGFSIFKIIKSKLSFNIPVILLRDLFN